MGEVISVARLRANLAEGWVVFDERGEPVDVGIPTTIGPAVFLVTPVTDAVKQLEANAVRSIDRDEMWAVEAIVLSEEVVSHMDDADLSAEELLTLVRDLGYEWAVSPISPP